MPKQRACRLCARENERWCPVVPVLCERDRLDVAVEVLVGRVGQRDVANLARVLLRGDGAAPGDPGVARRRSAQTGQAVVTPCDASKCGSRLRPLSRSTISPMAWRSPCSFPMKPAARSSAPISASPPRPARTTRGADWTALRERTFACLVAALKVRRAHVLPRFAAAEDAYRLTEAMTFALAGCVVAERFALV